MAGDALQTAVGRVLRNDTCTGCGVCVHVSTRIQLGLTDDGFLRPAVAADDGARGDETADEARLFDAVCPGVALAAPRPASAEVHPVLGAYQSVWRGWAADPETRRRGSSGGALSAISAWLLETGRASSLVASRASADEPRRTVPLRLTTRDEALTTAGSRYAPVANGTLFDPAASDGVFVGKPCEVSAGVRLMRAQARPEGDGPVRLAFFCAGTPSQRATDSLVRTLGVDPAAATALSYRGDGWPGRFTVSDPTTTASLSYDESWGRHLGRDLQFRCKICPDGTGEDADIAAGDFWYSDARGYPVFDDDDGVSVIIGRTLRGAALLEAARDAGVLHLEPLDPDDAVRVQPLQRERRYTLLARLWGRRLTGGAVPRYRGYGLLGHALRHPYLSARALAGTVRRSRRTGRSARGRG